MAADQPSLRERKRERTRHDLEVAAVTLAAAKGVDHATVDAISERAGVSPRTFFNYFETKEDAIVGLSVQPLDDVIAEHRRRYAGGSPLEWTIGVLVAAFGAAIADPECGAARRALMREHPQLVGRKFERVMRVNEALAPALREVLVEAGSPADGVDGVVDVVLAACAGALRSAFKQSGSASADPVTLERRAVALVRKAKESLA